MLDPSPFQVMPFKSCEGPSTHPPLPHRPTLLATSVTAKEKFVFLQKITDLYDALTAHPLRYLFKKLEHLPLLDDATFALFHVTRLALQTREAVARINQDALEAGELHALGAYTQQIKNVHRLDAMITALPEDSATSMREYIDFGNFVLWAMWLAAEPEASGGDEGDWISRREARVDAWGKGRGAIRWEEEGGGEGVES